MILRNGKKNMTLRNRKRNTILRNGKESIKKQKKMNKHHLKRGLKFSGQYANLGQSLYAAAAKEPFSKEESGYLVQQIS